MQGAQRAPCITLISCREETEAQGEAVALLQDSMTNGQDEESGFWKHHPRCCLLDVISVIQKGSLTPTFSSYSPAVESPLHFL